MLEFAQPMLLDAVARDFPELRILLTHLGHPFTEQALVLIGKHANIFTEVSGLSLRPRQLHQALLMAHEMGVTDKILFGSDFPRQTPRSAVEAMYSLTPLAQGAGVATVPREALRGIVERDAFAALGLPWPKRFVKDSPPAPSSPDLQRSEMHA
jgi:predicted TIM-barrel fold metal-dependent hydrolase